LTIILFCGVGCQTSALTASTMRFEKSSSVVENDSGEYSRPHCVSGCGHQLLDQARAVHGDLHDLVLAHAEHHAAEHRRHRVVDVDDGALGADAGFHGAADQLIARLGQHDDGDVVRNAVFLDQHAHEVEVGLRGRREADFDFLDADLHQLLEEAQLLLRAHRLDQRLVAVAQVGAHPDRRLGDGAVRPLAVGQLDGGEGTVFGSRCASSLHRMGAVFEKLYFKIGSVDEARF
jgi:S1-C subfamily serine protease